MHSPRPYGLLTVGGELTQDDSASIELLARRLTNLKELSGVQSLRMVRALPDGGYALAQDMGGTFRVITHKPDQKTKPLISDGLAKDYIPMLYSGVITKAILSDGEGLGMKLSEQTRRRLSNYNSNDNLPPKNVRLQRFRIDYSELVQEFAPKEEREVTPTQYAQQRPTWYSGAMAEVMQIVGGYGRQDISNLPNQSVERARFSLPAETLKLIQDELQGIRLPAYTGLPDVLGQFQYDYKFSNTDGVAFDDQNKPWLIKINNRGVWAMPFPLIPATTSQAFKAYVVKVGDEELLKILDRFGGMPSGEAFPREDVFQTWQRSGVVIKVCDVGGFYDHAGYSSMCGWSFNLKGTEGFNTCYEYHANGLGVGLSFKMKLKLGHVVNGGRLPTTTVTDPRFDVVAITRYLTSLTTLISENIPRNLAIKYKLRRTSFSDLDFLARNRLTLDQSDVNYWDNLQLEPIAQHVGSVTEVGRGFLYSLEKQKFQPQIKFPDPSIHGCVSYDFTPMDSATRPEPYPLCDTIMYGYYIGDELKVVKYFYDGRGFIHTAENDYEECMIVGSWTQTETTGSTSNNGNFYTTDFDQRVPFAPVTSTTTIVGKDKKFDSKPFFSFDFPRSAVGTLWRNRYFTHKTNIDTTEGRVLKIGICIPFYCRNAVLHATKNNVAGITKYENVKLYSIADPTSYRYWTRDFVFAFFGSLPIQKGKPIPVDGNPVWVEMEEYHPSSCSDFADQGAWIQGMPVDYAWLIHPKSNEWLDSGGGGAPKVQEYTKTSVGPSTETGGLMTNIIDGVGQILTTAPDQDYFFISPTENGSYFYRDGCKVVFGDSVYANVSEAGDGGRRKYWGYTNLVDHKSAHHFIGVINE